MLAVALMIVLSVYSVSADQCDYYEDRYGDVCGSDCCCTDSYDQPYCCSCSLKWWAWTLIGVGIVAVVIIAVALGVWRRRVYLRRTTIITTQAPVATTTVAMMAPPYSSNPRGAGYVSF
jgi:hypothetical protein